jgi:hypothetical protein
MKRVWLLGFLIVMSFACSRQVADIDLFRLVWDGAAPKKLKITRVVGGGREAFAVFAELPKSEFETFKKGTLEFTAWNPLNAGISFKIDKVELHSPFDFKGVYAVGKNVNGFVRVIAWDEQSGIVVVMLASGIM